MIHRHDYCSDTDSTDIIVIRLTDTSLMACERISDRECGVPTTIGETDGHILTTDGADIQQHFLRCRDVDLRAGTQRGDHCRGASDRWHWRRRAHMHRHLRHF